MSEFSIELHSSRVNDSRTRQAFEEVLSSYANGNYRSAVVMLWSVIVCDLLYKLDQLKTAYSDAAATEILKRIEDLQTANPKSPEWESKLIDLIKEKTHLLDAHDYHHITSLQQLRHLCAHPILHQSLELHTPNKETVRAHIRNALEGVLTKPPIMSRKVMDTLLEDLERMKDLLPDDPSLKRYLEAKYFPSSSPAFEKSIFRNLWKLTFRVTNDDCERNRAINFRAISILFDRNKSLFSEQIASDRKFFSDIEPVGTPLDYLLSFLRKYPSTFDLLGDEAKTPIRNCVLSDINRFSVAWFISTDFRRHITDLKSKITNSAADLSGDSFQALIENAHINGGVDVVLDIGILLYARSANFNSADRQFRELIGPYLELFTDAQLVELLDGIDANDQTYNRGRSTDDHGRVKAVCDARPNLNISWVNYPWFIVSTIDPQDLLKTK